MPLHVRRLLEIAFATATGVSLAGGCSPGSCTTDSDCGSDARCQFKVGSCEARGECLAGPAHDSFLYIGYCGCNGKMVRGGMGYLTGYASGPTTGADFYPSCVDSGSSPDDGGFLPTSDAALVFDVAEGGATTPSDATADVE